MSRIAKAFEEKKPLIAFITGGDPSVEKTKEFILEMIRGGVDMIEIGIPFSDPVAEGPTIQNASMRALEKGANVDKLFTMVTALRQETQIPLLFMTYLNPVFHYGYERFFSRCRECGLDGIIIPDLPFEERTEVAEFSDRFGIDLITMVAPTSDHRIPLLVQSARGFIYAVSSMGVTGTRTSLDSAVGEMVGKIKDVSDVPVAVGFGISTPDQAHTIIQSADGVIVGSALVEIIARHKDKAGVHLFEYVRTMKTAMQE